MKVLHKLVCLFFTVLALCLLPAENAMETEVGKQKLVRLGIEDFFFFFFLSISIKGDFLWNCSVKHSAPFIVISMAMTTFLLDKAGQKTNMKR